MVPLYSPRSESELMVLIALFNVAGIPNVVRGRGFASLYPGMQIEHYNTQTIMVPPSAFDEALELLTDFLAQPDDLEEILRLTLGDKVRVFCEVLLFAWCVPVARADDTCPSKI